MFQCDTFVQICLLLVPPSFWNRNDTKLPKPWKMSLILPNLHYTWTKRYISLSNIHSFVFQTKHFHWSSRNCLVRKVNLREKTFTLHGWTQMVVRKLQRCFDQAISAFIGFLEESTEWRLSNGSHCFLTLTSVDVKHKLISTTGNGWAAIKP